VSCSGVACMYVCVCVDCVCVCVVIFCNGVQCLLQCVLQCVVVNGCDVRCSVLHHKL